MKTPTSELKRRAKQKLKGRYGLFVGSQLIVSTVSFVIMLVYLGVVFALEFADHSYFMNGSRIRPEFIILQVLIFLAFLVMLSLLGLLMPGINKLYLNLCTGQPVRLSDMLFAFQNKPYRFLGFYFVNVVIALIWGIPYFVVLIVSIITDFIPVMLVLLVLMYLLWLAGSIITMLNLSQAMLILTESPDRKVFASFRESIDMMRGNKGRFFYLSLSFIGVILLGYGSLGIGYLWIMPYIQCTMVEFYLDMKAGRAMHHVEEQGGALYDSVWGPENRY